MNFGKFFGFIGSPSKAFDKEKNTTTGEAFKFMIFGFLILAVITTIIGGIVFVVASTFLTLFTSTIPFIGVMGVIGAGILAVIFFGVLIGGIIGLVIWSLWLHLWAYILGAKGGLNQTFKSVFYGMSPHYMLGWIPFVNIIIYIWSLVLQGIGLTKLHGITGGKAAGAIIIAIIIPVIIMIAIMGTMFMTMMSLMNTMMPPVTV